MTIPCNKCHQPIPKPYPGQHLIQYTCPHCFNTITIDTGFIVKTHNEKERIELNQITHIHYGEYFAGYTKDQYFLICHNEAKLIAYQTSHGIIVDHPFKSREPFITFEEWKLIAAINDLTTYHKFNIFSFWIQDYIPTSRPTGYKIMRPVYKFFKKLFFA